MSHRGQWYRESTQKVIEGVKLGYDAKRIASEFKLTEYYVSRRLNNLAYDDVANGATLSSTSTKYHISKRNLAKMIEYRRRDKERLVKE